MAAYRRYSVYLRADDTPVIIFQTAEKCAAAIGCTVTTFRSYLSKQRSGVEIPKKYAIYQDEVTEEDKQLLHEDRKPKLNDTDRRILSLMISGMSRKEIEAELGLYYAAARYHCKKVLRATGLDPFIKQDLIQLQKMMKIKPERRMNG